MLSQLTTANWSEDSVMWRSGRGYAVVWNTYSFHLLVSRKDRCAELALASPHEADAGAEPELWEELTLILVGSLSVKK